MEKTFIYYKQCLPEDFCTRFKQYPLEADQIKKVQTIMPKPGEALRKLYTNQKKNLLLEGTISGYAITLLTKDGYSIEKIDLPLPYKKITEYLYRYIIDSGGIEECRINDLNSYVKLGNGEKITLRALNSYFDYLFNDQVTALRDELMIMITDFINSTSKEEVYNFSFNKGEKADAFDENEPWELKAISKKSKEAALCHVLSPDKYPFINKTPDSYAKDYMNDVKVHMFLLLLKKWQLIKEFKANRECFAPSYNYDMTFGSEGKGDSLNIFFDHSYGGRFYDFAKMQAKLANAKEEETDQYVKVKVPIGDKDNKKKYLEEIILKPLE